MSNTSSDTESSCGWSIISIEGSDIETLMADVVGQNGADAQEQPEWQDSECPTSASGCNDDEFDGSLEEQTMTKTLFTSEAGADDPPLEDHGAMLSLSDSDIVTLQEVKEDERDGTEDTASAAVGSFLGTSCSSQYAFTATESVFPAQLPPPSTSSSSSGDEAAANVAVRRRRLRRTTTSESCEEDEETTVESEEEAEKQPASWQTAIRPATTRARSPGGRTLNSCILLALIIALSMGFGHFYGTMQVQERQKTDKTRESELQIVIDALRYHVKSGDLSLDDWDKQNLVSLLSHLIETSQENTDLSGVQQDFPQAQQDVQAMLARQREDEVLALTTMNQQLKISLEKEEKSLSTLQVELKSLRSRIRDLEATGASADALLSENRRLKTELEGEKELRKKLDKERKFEYEAEAQSRMRELEKRLGFEQQRSDMWERLYLQTKDDRAKGDTEAKVTKAKARRPGIVKETFDAVKNSTKGFVQHHKEQIKKAKEAVKENLRKFSNSVKSTFRHFKDSASTFINKMAREGTKQYEAGKYKKKKGHPKQDANTRKPGERVDKERGRSPGPKGCRGVFDCAYQESLSVFNKATEPIRADEFHQLLWSYLQREVPHFHHWKELENFINGFFHNGLFIHDRMRFTDFVSSVENYLVNMPEYHGLHNDVFEDVDDFIFRHLFGEAYAKSDGPSGPLERPDSDSREESRTKHQGRRQQRQRARRHGEQRNGHMADVKIELGPMPFDHKY
ncbi:cell cycle progression protein 1 [Festucalex cinctus]